MDRPHVPLEPLSCADCEHAGQPGVVMRLVLYEQQWMNVSTTKPDSIYPGTVSSRTERKKVRCALWRCPQGHRLHTVLE
jgi:hypothetical protein